MCKSWYREYRVNIQGAASSTRAGLCVGLAAGKIPSYVLYLTKLFWWKAPGKLGGAAPCEPFFVKIVKGWRHQWWWYCPVIAVTGSWDHSALGSPSWLSAVILFVLVQNDFDSDDDLGDLGDVDTSVSQSALCWRVWILALVVGMFWSCIFHAFLARTSILTTTMTTSSTSHADCLLNFLPA